MPITRHLILEKAMKSWTILAAALAIVLALQSPNGAVARDMGFRLPPNTKLPAPPAEGYRLVSMRFDVPTCLGLAEEAVKHTRVDNRELFGIKKGRFYVGGHISDTRGDIICVQLPKAGACNGDGATAVIVGAGPNAKQMTVNMATQMHTLVENRTLIDCN